MVRRMIGGMALACIVAVPVAGCGGDDKSDAGVAWAGKVCAGVKENTRKVQLPTLDPSDAKKSKSVMLAFLKNMASQLEAQQKGVKAVGAPPVEEGRRTYDTTLANLAKLRGELVDVIKGLEKSKVTDMKSLSRALSSYQATMSAFNSYQGPAKELRANAALNTAFADAPQCNGVGV